MSLYNLLFGTNPFVGMLLQLLKVDVGDIPRFRDCYLDDDNNIVIYTRTGGGNRDNYETENEHLHTLSGFISDEDDDFDCTYASFTYKPDEAQIDLIELLSGLGAVNNPEKAWKDMLEGMEKKDMSNPQVAHAFKVGEQIMDQLTKVFEGQL